MSARADHLAVLVDQAAVGLEREERLRRSGDGERIDDAGEDGEEPEKYGGRAKKSEHDGLPFSSHPAAKGRRR